MELGDFRPQRDKRGRRGIRTVANERSAGGESAAKFRNKSWRREDVQSEDMHAEPQSTTTPFGTSTNGMNGFTHAQETNNAASHDVFGKPFESPNLFGQSNSAIPSFSATPTSSPVKRNAFGAVIHPGPSQPVSATTQSPVSIFASSKNTPLNPAAASFTPRTAISAPTSAFSSPFQNPTPSPFGTIPPPQSSFNYAMRPVQSVFGSLTPSVPASTREGGHVSMTRIRARQLPPWKTQESLALKPPLPRAPRDAPPYQVPPSIQRDIEQGKYASDERFPGNRFLELKAMRPSMRTHSIKHKLISDPEHRTDLTGAITVVGTCMDMCPEYERHEREFQKDVDDWEKIPGTSPKRIDHARAVKKYRRSAAGNDEPLESDLRPPEVLKMTLDYLFYELLDQHGLEATYAFIRDRTRAVRTDFTIQHEKGPIAVECFERIARFHILALHRFCERDDVRGFDYWQEVEQMMKTLQSLMQFYDDNEGKIESPNEAEFRAYYILAHIRDTNSLRRLQSLAPNIFFSPVLQTAIEFRAYAQRNTHIERRSSSHRAAKLKFRNSEACLNTFTRFFKRVKHEGTSYLMACLLEYHFGGVRKGAVHALWKAYTARHRALPAEDLKEMLGGDDVEKTVEVAQRFGMGVVEEKSEGEEGVTLAVQMNKNSRFEYGNQMTQRHSASLVEIKRADLSDVDIVDGRFEKAYETWALTDNGVDPSSVTMTMPAINTSVVAPRKPSSVSLPPRRVSVVSSPQLSFPSPVPFPSAAPSWSIFNQPSPGITPSPFQVSSVLQAQSQPFGIAGPSTAPSFPKPVSSIPSPSPAPAPWTTTLAPPTFSLAIPAPPNNSGSTFSALTSTPIPSRASPVVVPPPVSIVVPSPDPAEIPSPRLATPVSVPIPEVPAPPRPTQEEILFQQQQERRQAKVVAQARADRHFKFQVLFNIFTLWKRSVMNRGHAREVRKMREEQFKRSIRDMGLGVNTSSVTGSKSKGKQRADYSAYAEEDVVSWEDTSQASVSTGVRRRSRKSLKRADDEATLVAIKEAEATRLKLWERGTFLSAIKKHVERRAQPGNRIPDGWEVWLSTNLENTSTTDWLRMKFGIGNSTDPTGLDRVSLDDLYTSGHGPGVIVVDLSPSMDESVINADVLRIQAVVSSLPSSRHYLPSILLLQWTEPLHNLPTSISSELNQLRESGVIGFWETLAFVNDGRHFDDQFEVGIKRLSIDITGRLVDKASIDDVFQMFFKSWDMTLNEWVHSCQSGDGSGFDWILYGKVLAVMIGHINLLATEVLQVCQINPSFERLPPFEALPVVDRLTAFETSIQYLNTGWLASNQSALLLRTELILDLSAGRDFYVKTVPERLAHLMLGQLSASLPDDASFFLGKDTHSSVATFTEVINSTLELAITRVQAKPSPAKKRGTCEDLDKSMASDSSARPDAKRRKHDMILAAPNGHTEPNGHPARQGTLSRLRSITAKARQSVEDLQHSRHDAEQCNASTGDESDMWETMSMMFDPGQRSRRASLSSSLRTTLFDPKANTNLSLVPHSELGLPAMPSNHVSSTHSLPFFASAESRGNENEGQPRRYPQPHSNGTQSATSTSLALSFTPPPTNKLDKLRNSLARAKKTLEQSRRDREVQEGS
ncbi:hypothetical protein K439DRAFT_1418180 [Ramaria rubella]|nr:hypothetical protein K439DRAFT_1418180 [Ramaria rubella]